MMTEKEYIEKGEQWCIEYADEIDWNKFECEMNTFSKEFQEDFRFEIKRYTWRNEKGELHREDGPAYEDADGTKKWYLNGKLHREGGPAVEGAEGVEGWYLNGKVHREEGPAIIFEDGSKEWYLNGKLHREDGPALEWENGDKRWYLNGKFIREEGGSCSICS